MFGFDIMGYLIFAFVMTITPGPNNYLLFSYGKNFGFKDSGKLMTGIFLGFTVYLAFMMSKVNHVEAQESNLKLGFVQGFLMQFVNPKAWLMAIGGASAFMPHLNNLHLNVFVFAMIFGIIGIPSMIVWVLFGDIISKFLKSDRAARILGDTLFVLMLVSIVTIWI